MTDTTKSLLPNTASVVVNGETITLKPFTFGQLPSVASRLGPLYGMLSAAKAGQTVDIGYLMAAGGVGLMDVLCIAAGKPSGWTDEIVDLDEGFALAQVVLDLNKDNFKKKILPFLGNMLSTTKPPAAMELPEAQAEA